MGPLRSGLALVGLLLLPAAAGGSEIYSYVDANGVIHYTNAPSDPRYRKLTRANEVAGLYRTRPRSATRPAPPGDAAWEQHIRLAADKYRLPRALLRAVMAVESNFDPHAVSEKGACGLMQLMPQTAREMYVADVWDPAQNIEGGARYLRLLANQYSGDMLKTLAAYNAGPDAVRRAGGGVPEIRETKEYVRKVVTLYEDFKAGR